MHCLHCSSLLPQETSTCTEAAMVIYGPRSCGGSSSSSTTTNLLPLPFSTSFALTCSRCLVHRLYRHPPTKRFKARTRLQNGHVVFENMITLCSLTQARSTKHKEVSLPAAWCTMGVCRQRGSVLHQFLDLLLRRRCLC